MPSSFSGQPVQPQRAPVVPRARRLPDGETLPLEQIVRQFLDHHEWGVIHLDGGPGSGKTTALRHLAAALPSRAPVFLFDDTPPNDYNALARGAVVVMASDVPPPPYSSLIARVALAPWCQDDVIEYLLATRPTQCAAVMARVNHDPDAARLGGSPMLWRMALDGFAEDDSLRFVASALRRRVFAVLRAHNCATAAMIWCLKRARGEQPLFALPEPVIPILAQPAVMITLAAERMADLLSVGEFSGSAVELPAEVVREASLLVRCRPMARERLRQLMRKQGECIDDVAPTVATVGTDACARHRPLPVGRSIMYDMAADSIDAKKVIEEFCDHLAPKLDTYEQAIYLYILRHSRWVGEDVITIGFKSARRKLSLGIGEKGKPMSEGTCYEKLRSLQAKGCIEILDVTRSGTKLKLHLPRDIPGVVVFDAETPTSTLEELDFFNVAENRARIIEREGNRCFYCLRSVDTDNYVIEHVTSRPDGDHSYRNVVAACRTCNNRKGSQTAEEYLRALYRHNYLSAEDFEERGAALVNLRRGELKPPMPRA